MYEAFDRFAEDPRIVSNWLGVVTRRDYFDPSFAYAEFGLPGANQDLLEWHGLLGALEVAQGSFSMIEAGAGYGRGDRQRGGRGTAARFADAPDRRRG